MPKHLQGSLTVGQVTVTTTKLPITSFTSSDSTSTPANAFDGNLSTVYSTVSGENWLAVSFTEPKVITKIWIMAGPGISGAAMKLQASNDGENINMVTLSDFEATDKGVEVIVNNTKEYKFYRVWRITSSEIAELEFYGENRTFANDINGTFPSDLSVNRIKGRSISLTSLENNRVITYVAASNSLSFKSVSVPPTKLVLQSSATATLSMSGATYVTALSIVIPAGTPAGSAFLIELTTSTDITRRGGAAYFAIHNNGTMITESERIIDNSSSNSNNSMMKWSVYCCAIVTTTGVANETFTAMVRSSANNNTVNVYQRVLTAMRLK
jgi:hypothetical protein